MGKLVVAEIWCPVQITVSEPQASCPLMQLQFRPTSGTRPETRESSCQLSRQQRQWACQRHGWLFRLGIEAGYKYLFKCVVVAVGPEKTNESDLVRHCSESGTLPGSSSTPDSSVSKVWRLHEGELHPFRLSRWRSSTFRHVIILHRAMSDGACRTIDGRRILAPTMMFTAMHQGGPWVTQ